MAIKVQGSTIIDDSKRILDGNNNVGTSGSILSATGSGFKLARLLPRSFLKVVYPENCNASRVPEVFLAR